MAMIDWVDARLDRWAEWHIVSSKTSAAYYGGSVLGREYTGGTRRDPGKPIAAIMSNEAECLRTASAIAGLPPGDRLTINEYYLNGTLAAIERLAVSRSALSQRLSRIHLQLAEVFVREREKTSFRV